MKKVFLTLALSLGTFVSAFAGGPIGSGPIACGGNVSVRHFKVVNGINQYYGDYYYFNTLEDAFSYILFMYPTLEYPETRNEGANIVCTIETNVPGPVGP